VQLGDRVVWANDYRGRTIKTEGVIVGVIAPGERPGEDEFPEFWVEYGPGADREEESYVVQVDSSTKTKRKLFWPNAKLTKESTVCAT
jgi:hypothetical protein